MQTITAERYLELRIRSWRLYRYYRFLAVSISNKPASVQRSLERKFWELNDSNVPLSEAKFELYKDLTDCE